jgi:hypothetical protein
MNTRPQKHKRKPHKIKILPTITKILTESPSILGESPSMTVRMGPFRVIYLFHPFTMSQGTNAHMLGLKHHIATGNIAT